MNSFPRRFIAFACAFCALTASLSAAADMFLQIKGVKGETRIVACPNGACVVDGLAAGTYTVQMCDANGKVLQSDVALEYAVVSPRDAASGLPTGKRQHKPVRMTQSSGGAPTAVIEVTEAGAKVSIKASGKAQDHNSSRSNKSSS